MNREHSYVEEMTDRYIYQVARRLPAKARPEIEAELRSLISDMLEERSRGSAPEKKDIDCVLTELGSPAAFASRYQEGGKALIGPEYYPRYCLVLKIVLAAVAGALVLSTFILAVIAPEPDYAALLLDLLAELFSGLAAAFAFVTLIFAFFERRQIRLDALSGDSFPFSLPPVPPKRDRIPRGECIVNLVFSALVLVLFLFFSDLLGAWIYTDRMTVIPIFAPELVRRYLLFFVLFFALGAARDICKLLEGRYTMRLALVTGVSDALALAASLFVFTRPGFWNADFLPQLFLHFPAEDLPTWPLAHIPQLFLCVLTLAFALDFGVTLFRALRGRGAQLRSIG